MRRYLTFGLLLATILLLPKGAAGAEPINALINPWTFKMTLADALEKIDPVLSERGVFVDRCKLDKNYSCEVIISGRVRGRITSSSQLAPIDGAIFFCNRDCVPEAYIALIKAMAAVFDGPNSDGSPLLNDVITMLREPAGALYREGTAARYVVTSTGGISVAVMIQSRNVASKVAKVQPTSVDVYSYGARRWLRFNDVKLVLDEQQADDLFAQPFSLYCSRAWGGLIAGMEGSFYAANEMARSTLAVASDRGEIYVRLRDGFDSDSPVSRLLDSKEAKAVSLACAD